MQDSKSAAQWTGFHFWSVLCCTVWRTGWE